MSISYLAIIGRELKIGLEIHLFTEGHQSESSPVVRGKLDVKILEECLDVQAVRSPYIYFEKNFHDSRNICVSLDAELADQGNQGRVCLRVLFRCEIN